MGVSDIAVDVLIPTRDRPSALAITLTGLAAQSVHPLRIVISDQSARAVQGQPEIVGLLRYLRHVGHSVVVHHHLPVRGMAEQRAFLLDQVHAEHCLYLDDDVITEPDLVDRLHQTLVSQRCGFVGSALHGLSFIADRRPEQQSIEFWQDRVQPERIPPHTAHWQRHRLHSAANLMHVQQTTSHGSTRTLLYKIAWVGGCVMFDSAKLRDCGGFDFWRELPVQHCGEDVLAQLRVMARYGGCAMLPSGAYHLELPTSLPSREVDAPLALPHWLPKSS